MRPPSGTIVARVILVIVMALFSLQAGLSKGTPTIFRMLKPYEGNPKQEVWFQPMLPAYFSFRIERGTMPEAGAISCMARTEQRSTKGVSYPVVVLECEGGRTLALTGVSFR